MQRILIDTATAAPEVVALVMALNEPDLHVEAITTLMGKVSASNATRNTLLSIAAAGAYQPPVFDGLAKPMFREHRDASLIYGLEGLGNLPVEETPVQTKAQPHAVDAIINAVRQWGSELEILCLGPLTNLALAITKAPEVMRQLRRITLMGGAAFEGNAGPVAEFNIWQDAEAADIVFSFGVPLVMVTHETVDDDATLNAQDLERLDQAQNHKAAFCLDCCKSLMRLGEKTSGAPSLALDAPIALAVLAIPQLVRDSFESYTRVETQGSAQVYGTAVNDRRTDETHPFRANASETIGAFNCQVVHRIDGVAFKDYLLELLVK
jgi:purine nucleosidase